MESGNGRDAGRKAAFRSGLGSLGASCDGVSDAGGAHGVFQARAGKGSEKIRLHQLLHVDPDLLYRDSRLDSRRGPGDFPTGFLQAL